MADALARTLRSRDFQLALVGAVTAVVSLGLAMAPPRAVPVEGDLLPLAEVSASSGEVKRRSGDALGWRPLATHMPVFDGDAVFVPPGGEATLRFDDGTELGVDERSLVVLERPRAGRHALLLRQGAVSGRAGQVGVDIQTPVGLASLGAASEARVELSEARVEVAVSRGQAAVSGAGGTRAVTGGQRVGSGRAGLEALAPWPVELRTPEANLRQLFRGAPSAVTLTWAGAVPVGGRLQVAHDRLFAFVEHDLALGSERYVLEKPKVGVTWWRVVGARGEPVSGARRFTLVEDVAPAPVQPRVGEVVLAPRGSTLVFAWTALPGVAKYRLEVCATEGFEALTVGADATTTQLRLPVTFDEGSWYWRVRAADGDEPGLPSKPTRFRLIHTSIPAAPELLTPQLEVGQ
jgi:hypothetical protein